MKSRFIFSIFIFGIFLVENAESMFGNSGRSISSSNYLTVSRTSLKRGSVITLTPKGWLSRAIKGVRTGTLQKKLCIIYKVNKMYENI